MDDDSRCASKNDELFHLCYLDISIFRVGQVALIDSLACW
jgi:hypothetical protein